MEYTQLEKIIKIFNFFNCKNFVETGTFIGITISGLSKYFENLYTIEISEKLYKYNCEKWKDLKNINFIHGDSSEKLDEVIGKIEGECIFFLDGHFSGHNAVFDHLINDEKLKGVAYKTSNNERIWKKNRVVIPTEKGTKDVPLYEELRIIDHKCKNKTLIIIDDFRLFGKKYEHGDWRNISTQRIKNQLKNKKILNSQVIDDRFILLID